MLLECPRVDTRREHMLLECPLVDEFSKKMMTYINALGTRVRHWIVRKLYNTLVVLEHRKTRDTLPK